MADEEIKLEGAKLITFSPKSGGKDDGPKLSLAFAVEVDTVAGYMNRLTRIYRKGRSITIGFAGLNVKGAELYTFSPKAAKITKDGDETEPPKMALGFTVDLAFVEDKLSRISELWRSAKAALLSLEAIEQLELQKQPAAAQTLTAALNGNGAHDADLAKTKRVTPAKGKSKKRVHQPI
jgi:hypothetical protein